MLAPRASVSSAYCSRRSHATVTLAAGDDVNANGQPMMILKNDQLSGFERLPARPTLVNDVLQAGLHRGAELEERCLSYGGNLYAVWPEKKPYADETQHTGSDGETVGYSLIVEVYFRPRTLAPIALKLATRRQSCEPSRHDSSTEGQSGPASATEWMRSRAFR